MLHDPKVAFVQGALEIRDFTTFWGWYQYCKSRFSLAFTARLYERLHGRRSPCYGHGVLFNAQVLRRSFALERQLKEEGKSVRWLVVGKKGRSTLTFRHRVFDGDFVGFTD